MRSKVRAYSIKATARADQQAGYISATSDSTPSLAKGSRSIHSGQQCPRPLSGTSGRFGSECRGLIYLSGRFNGAQRKLIMRIGSFRVCPFCDLRIASLIGRPDRSFNRIRPNNEPTAI